VADLPRKACWQAEDARAMLQTEALVSDRSVFLATHSPIQDFEIEGTRGSEVEQPTEGALLDALASPDTHHAFCVVEGEPGSGKSHLIRWLDHQWPVQDDRVLLIQRADGSLQGTLSQLQKALPAEHQHLFEHIGRPQNVTLAGRARVFHTNLAHALRPDHLETPLRDSEWCAKWDLADLLGTPELLDQWSAPERIITLLSGKKGDAPRDQELARFNLDDIIELEQRLRPLKPRSSRAVRFARKLQKEVDDIRELGQQERSDPATREDLRSRFPYTLDLVDALNLRRNDAVQQLLGISHQGLKDLFMRLREVLNTRLVLLLEDITAWEGVDEQLIDVLVTDVATRQERDLCPMVSVVGVTPAYFRSAGFHANYRQRITHHVRLGHESRAHQYQDVSSLRTPEARVAFAARYLRAVRIGADGLKAWGGNGPLPNPCDTCPSQEACHAAFGARDGVGLYPFTERAIDTLFETFRDPEGRATYQTPRGMLQGVLVPTLTFPDRLESGEYPGREIEIAWIPEEQRRLVGYARDVLHARIEDEDTRERTRRLIAYWGSHDLAALKTLRDESGALTYAGIRQGVYQAFELPWLGEDEAEGTAEPVVVRRADTPPAPATPRASTAQPEAPRRQQPERQPRQTPRTRTGPRRATRPELQRLQGDIDTWREGGTLRDPTRLNQLAHEVLQELPVHLGVPGWLWRKLFTPESVMLEGTKAARRTHFVLPAEDWVGKGLKAYAELRRADEPLSSEVEESYQRHLASMVRRLKGVVLEHANKRIPSLADDAPWPVADAAAQLLLARAWLRGTVSPTAPTWQQWRAALHPEPEATTNPQARVDTWSEVVDKTKGSHGKLRTLLQDWVNLSPGDRSGAGLIDATTVAPAVLSLQETLDLAPLPPDTSGTGGQLAELDLLVRNAKEVAGRLPKIPRYEADRLAARAQAIDQRLRGMSVREHIARLDRAIRATAEELPGAAAVAVQEWMNAKRRLDEQGFTDPSDDTPGTRIEDFIDALASSTSPQTPAELLTWTQQAPAQDLALAHAALDQGEKTVSNLLQYVENYLQQQPGGDQSLDTFHRFGQRIQNTANAIRQALEG
jgi:hypothetical protein